MKLSTSDRRLLQALQNDVTQSQADLADEAGLSRSSCWRRIREFEKAGLIRQKVALLDPKIAGFGIEVLLLVAMTEHTDENRREFESHVRRLQQAAITGGKFHGKLHLILIIFELIVSKYSIFKKNMGTWFANNGHNV